MPIENNKIFVLSEHFEGSRDPMRNATQRFWTSDGDQITVKKVGFDIHVEDSETFPAMSTNTLVLPYILERIKVSISPFSEISLTPLAESSAKAKIENAINDINPEIFYEDYSFDLRAPIVYPSKHDNDSLLRGEINFIYNYGLQLYEDTIAPADFNENSTLNYYNYFERKDFSSVEIGKWSKRRDKIYYFNHEDPVTDINPTISKDDVITKLTSDSYIGSQRSEQNYFITSKDYTSAMALKDSAMGSVYTVPDSPKGPIFPFYNEIVFEAIGGATQKTVTTSLGPPTSKTITYKDADGNKITRTVTVYTNPEKLIVTDSDAVQRSITGAPDVIRTALCTSVASYVSDLVISGGDTDYFTARDFVNSTMIPSYSDSDQKEFIEYFQVESNSIKLIDVEDMINNLVNLKSPSMTPQTRGFYKDQSEEAKMAYEDLSLEDNEGLRSDREAALSIFTEELQLMIGEQSRSYSEILRGVKSPTSGILFYRIAKFDAEAESSDFPIQNIWIPGNSSPSNKIATYIDFQVKYGKRYTYKVYAYKIVIGTTYNFLSIPEGAPALEESYFAGVISNYELLKNYPDGFGTKVNFSEVFSSFYTIVENYKKTIGKSGIYTPGVYFSNAWGTSSSAPSIEGLLDYLLTLANLLFGTTTSTVASQLLESLETPAEDVVDLPDYLATTGGLTDELKAELENLDSEIVDYLNALASILENFAAIRRGTPGKALKKVAVPGRTVEIGSSTPLPGSDHLLSSKEIEELASTGKKGVYDGAEYVLYAATQQLYAANILLSLDILADAEDSMLTSFQEVLTSEVVITPVTATDSLVYYSKEFQVSTFPLPKVVEIPYYQDSGAILDNPPLFPDVNFIPYKGVDKSMSLFLNSNFGEENEVPIIFNEAESGFYALFRESKKYNDIEPILFKTDEFENAGSFFEIYRIGEKPSSYNNFLNSLRATVSTTFEFPLDNKSIPAASFTDTIKPNRKYYYTFRMSDRRGIISNPSPVFELEMINSDGLIFPIIKPFEFEEAKKPRQISFGKWINMIPSYAQITPRFNATVGSYDGWSATDEIGVQSEALYGNSFKLRMTSKDTGRVIDLNLTFEVENLDE